MKKLITLLLLGFVITSKAQTPIHHFKFDNSLSNTAGNLSLTARNASYTYENDWKGNTQSCLSFNNISQYFSANISNLPQGSSARTISFWINFPNKNLTCNCANQYILFYGTYLPNNVFGISQDAFAVSNWAYGNDHNANLSYNYNTWYHYAIVYNGTTSFIYRDGVLISQSNRVFNTQGTNFELGRNSGGSFTNGLNAKIDDLKIFDVALTANQVLIDKNGFPPSIDLTNKASVGANANIYFKLNAQSSNTTVTYKWGTTKAVTNNFVDAYNYNSSRDTNLILNLSGLTTGTKTYYQISATNANGTTDSPIDSFIVGVSTLKPMILSKSATVTTTTATINYTGIANATTTTGAFIPHGLTSTLTNFINGTNITGLNIMSGSATFTALAPSTTYYYAVALVNANGTTTSDTVFFTTLDPISKPEVANTPVSSISNTTATINYSIRSNYATTNTTIKYGTSTTNFTSTAGNSFNVVAGNGLQNSSTNLSGLIKNTQYYYQIVAINSAGKDSTLIDSFTTTNSNVSLIREFKFDNSNSDVSNTVSFTNSGGGFTTNRNGNANAAKICNGSAVDNVVISNLPQGNSARSISMWFKRTNNNATTTYPFYYGSNLDYKVFGCGVNTTQIKMFVWQPSGADPSVNFTSNSTSWYHVVITNNTSNVQKIYVNGVKLLTTNQPLNTQGTTFELGKYGFAGAVDDLKIYSGEVSDAEATNLYNFNTLTSDAPIISNITASNIAKITATINYTLKTNGYSTTSNVKYSINKTNLLNTTTGINIPAGNLTPYTTNVSLTGLSASTTYYYQVEASNSIGTTLSVIDSFVTLNDPAKPTVAKTDIIIHKTDSSTINYTVKCNYASTNSKLIYGTLINNLNNTVPGISFNVLATNTVQSSKFKLTGLVTGLKYYYQVIATNSVGSDSTVIDSFTMNPKLSGLLAYYSFNGANGNSHDGTHNLSVVTWNGPGYGIGKYGRGANFSGAEGLGNFTMWQVFNNSEFTICFWEKRAVYTLFASAFELFESSFFRLDGPGSVEKYQYGMASSSSNWVTGHSNKTLAQLSNTWHHIAVRLGDLSGTKYLSLYIDGVLDAQVPATALNLHRFHNSFTVGCGTNGSGVISNFKYFKGSLDEMYVYSRALEVTEINDIMNSPNALSLKPIISNVSSSNINDVNAIINFDLKSNRSATTSVLNYGTSITNLSNTVSGINVAATTTTAIAANISLTGLTPSTTYYYQIEATNNAGISKSEIDSFKTSDAITKPTVSKTPATAIAKTGVTINYGVKCNNGTTTTKIKYGTNVQNFNIINGNSFSVVAGNILQTGSTIIGGLSYNKKYYYQIVATNSTGRDSTVIDSFTTLAATVTLIREFKFDNSNADINNAISFTNTGGGFTTDRNGNATGAKSCNGTTVDNVVISNLPQGGAARSVSMWFKRTNNSGSTAYPFYYGVNNASQVFSCAVNTSQIKMFIWDQVNADPTASYTSNATSWYHVVLTTNGSSGNNIYVNGVNVLSAFKQLNTAGTTFELGKYGFAGAVDDLKIYSGELDASEVSDLFNFNKLGGDDSMKISGRIITPLRKPIKSVNFNVTIDGAATQRVDSAFNINVANGKTIKLQPKKNNDIAKANGVTSTDVLFVQRHILNTAKLNSPYKIIAADVDGNKLVNSTDVLRIKRLILGTDTTFRQGTTTENRTWAFIDSSFVFTDTTNPFPFKDSIMHSTVTSNKINQTFIGVKLGDVTYDWNAAIAKRKAVELLSNIELEILNNEVKCNFGFSKTQHLASLQSIIHFDNTKYEFVTIKNNNLGIDYNATNANETGTIKILWVSKDGEPQEFTTEDVLFELVLKAKANIQINQSEILNTKLEIGEAIAVNESLNEVDMVLKTKTINNNIEPTENKVAIYPTVVTKNTIVEVATTTAKAINIILTNTNGVVINKQQYQLQKGNNTINYNMPINTNGNYYITLQDASGNILKTTSIIKQ